VYLEIKMGLASHFGPWRLGTVPNTTGTTAGTINNMGATIVAQKAAIAYGTTTGTAFVIPAGATITGIALYSSTAFTGTSPTLTVSVAGTAVTTANALTSGTAFNGSLALAQTVGAAGVLNNVGSTDASVTYAIGGSALSAGVGTIVVSYMVNLSDGTYNPTAYTA
jgi:hypothetical protein